MSHFFFEITKFWLEIFGKRMRTFSLPPAVLAHCLRRAGIAPPRVRTFVATWA